MTTPLEFDELELALNWASAGSADAQAYICRRTGRVFLFEGGVPVDEGGPEEVDECEDPQAYTQAPDADELGLGTPLVMRYANAAPERVAQEIRETFSRKGAYARFKDLLDREGLTDDWHAFQARETRRALEAWAEENGFELTGNGPSQP